MQILSRIPNMRQVITCDLASSEKDQKKSSDPDYTVLLRGSMVYDAGVPKIFVFDVKRFREAAVKRNNLILEYMQQNNYPLYKETFGAYKDTYIIMKDILMGKRTVSPLILSGNKEAKADPLRPIFEAGNVYLVKAPWNKDFIDECRLFPKGIHDDMVDCLAMLYHVFKRKPTIRGGRGIW